MDRGKCVSLRGAPMVEVQSILERYVAAPGLLPALRFWVTNQKVASALLGRSIRDAETLERQVAAAIH